MWRHIASNALTFLVVLVFLLGGVLLWAQNEYASEGPLEQAICVQVDRGQQLPGRVRRLGGGWRGVERGPVADRGGLCRQDPATEGGIVPLCRKVHRWSRSWTSSRVGGASTCGTEVVYRVSIARATVQVRELDPATGRFVEIAEFNPGGGCRSGGLHAGEGGTGHAVSCCAGGRCDQLADRAGAQPDRCAGGGDCRYSGRGVFGSGQLRDHAGYRPD